MILVESDLSEEWDSSTDWPALAERCAAAAFSETSYAALATATVLLEVSVKFTSDQEVHRLNRDYRGKDKPTNVLSFPMVDPAMLAAATEGDDVEILLGDIVLAHGVCTREAGEREIAVETHAAHLLVHGTLHLLGYDHETGDAEADAMEEAERRALAHLGIADPYALSQLQD